LLTVFLRKVTFRQFLPRSFNRPLKFAAKTRGDVLLARGWGWAVIDAG